jgi:hypothetical protein
MFGPRYFGRRYYARRYFGSGAAAAVLEFLVVDLTLRAETATELTMRAETDTVLAYQSDDPVP